MERSSVGLATRVIRNRQADSLVGRTIGHYKISERIGTGGMGDVYLATDIVAGRKAALKLLPAHFTGDAERLKRFQQEAHAVVGLNHPNILTVYEIGEDHSIHYIASELIEGETLRDRLTRGPMQLSEAVDIAIQVATALTAAHQSGIIHRDIKPENIMLRPDGYVKVLDFGIAKLSERPEQITAEEAPTVIKVQTDQGTIIGTAHYMSPEQARAEKVDARTDIWSLGVVLYEMLAERQPFEGNTPQDVIASILRDQPTPLPQEVPDRLTWIVEKALRKDKDARYQTVKEVLSDLRELEPQRSASSQPGRVTAGVGDQAGRGSEAEHKTPAGALRPEQGTSSAEYVVTQIKSHRKSAAIVFLIFVTAIAGLSFGLYKLIGRKTVAPGQAIKITKLTNNGRATQPAISPDGKFVAYVVTEGERQSIWLRLADDPTSTAQLVPPTEALPSGFVPLNESSASGFVSLNFAPDGKSIYYLKSEGSSGNATVFAVYQVPVLGGTTKKVIANAGPHYILSHDGKQIAFPRLSLDRGEEELTIVNSDGSAERVIAQRKLPEILAPLAWSPDGQMIACVSATSS